ncbi:MAG: DNA-binding protein [Flavobacterium sp.]|nr:MAG: DNA-binding protein [Flavobacterium sp.]
MGYFPMNEEEFKKFLSDILDKKLEQFFTKYYSIKEKEKISANISLMTMKETEMFFGISRTTLWKWIKENKIDSQEIKGKRYFDKNYLIRFKDTNFRYNERLQKNSEKYCR